MDENTELQPSLRKDSSERLYAKADKSSSLLDEELIQEWQYWVLVKNRFPYDMAFSKHDLLVTKRKVSEDELSEEEKAELEKIIPSLEGKYDSRLINYPSKLSVKDHFHIHLLKFKKDRKDLKF